MKNTKKYKVKSGDTLGKLAQDRGLTTDQLLELNPIVRERDPSGNLILIGEDINVPDTGGDEKAESTMPQISHEVESKNGANKTKETSDEIPPEALVALAWAISRKGRAFQPCETLGCLYNYDPKQKGNEACKTPTSKASPHDREKNNHKDLHPYWFFHCARFAQHAYGLKKKGHAIGMYNTLNQKGAVIKNTDAPEGAFVFWRLTKYGHVGISSGNGKVVHTGIKKALRKEGIREDLISEISDRTYLGWAYPPKDWLV